MSGLRAKLGRLRDHWFLADLPSRTAGLAIAMDDLRDQLGLLVLESTSASGDVEPDVRIFSQWGEDGILVRLTNAMPDIPKTFVEIGVEDYRECNTRFLARRGWRGVAFDGDVEAVQRAQSLREVWSGDVEVAAEWVEPANVNQIIAARGLTGAIGVLSIDVDGIDYHLLDAVNVVSPWIVVMEYNARYGPQATVTVPYQPGFDRREEHHSWLHHGVSLAGLEAWGTERGYDLVTVNRQGTNAFLIAAAHRPDSLPRRTAADLWRPLLFSEHHNTAGVHEPITFDAERAIVKELPTVDVGALLAQRATRNAVDSPDLLGS